MRVVKFAVAAAAALLSTAASAEWFEARTNHFIIYSESNRADTIAFAERLERFDNALRVLQRMPTSQAEPDVAKVVVYRFGDTHDIGTLAGSDGVAGFYIPRAAYPVAFTPAKDYHMAGSLGRTDERIELKPGTVLFHEYTHHFMLRNFPATYPGWYVEGFAEVNSTIELRPDGSFLVGKPANHRSIELFEMQQLHVRKLLDPNYKYTSIEEVVQKYSMGWLLSHYLTFDKPRAGQLATYLKLLGEGKPGLAAAEQAFGDLNKLNSELQKYKSTNMPAIEVRPAAYAPPTVSIRLVDPSEERFMRQRIQLARGVTRSDARRINAALGHASAEDPKNFLLQLLAAEAGLDALDFATASAAADRALALAPNSVDALIFKARTLIEAKDGPADRFAQARKLLVQARSIDKADPRPLIEYYMSYRRAGQRPIPEVAIFALEDAYDLAKHDRYYRLILTRQLLEENRAAPAAQVLAPLAFSFDGRDPEKNYAGKAMTAVQAGDVPGALAILAKELDKLESLTDDS
ncbi:MAG: hypothetical protein ACKOPE_10010 [Novosphingobium sp.]